MKRIAYAGLVGSLLSAAVLTATATSAQAAARDGVCQTGEFCLYYNSGQLGSVSDFAGSIDDYGASQPECYDFKGAGAGQGLCVKNAAASVWNRTSGNVTVFFNSGYGGASQSVGSGVKANLNATLKNQNASHRFGGSTGSSYGAPGTNPHPEAITRAPSATARTQFVDNEIARLTGETQCFVGDYRTYQESTSNHNTGNALDCTISSAIGTYPNATQKAQGWKLAEWVKQYAVRLQVRYVIWDGKIWSVGRASEGWRTYTGGSGVTGGHYDHVHVSIQNRYGD
ncbi:MULTISPECIES: peptidase inhibitor family I36 protein [unclassified Knoellia]|uniref:peptidase inhibitor family I36 protein n=1 Tax=Knoellia altitudinis TaxID=3404795 RepID=UPI0036220CB9